MNEGQCSDDEHSGNVAPGAPIQSRTEIGRVLKEETADRATPGQSRDHENPTGQKAGQRSERGTGVYEWSACLRKAAGYLRETHDHEPDNGGTRYDCPQTLDPKQGVHLRRQAEDSGID